jgi:hypothetical protein
MTILADTPARSTLLGRTTCADRRLAVRPL